MIEKFYVYKIKFYWPKISKFLFHRQNCNIERLSMEKFINKVLFSYHWFCTFFARLFRFAFFSENSILTIRSIKTQSFMKFQPTSTIQKYICQFRPHLWNKHCKIAWKFMPINILPFFIYFFFFVDCYCFTEYTQKTIYWLLFIFLISWLFLHGLFFNSESFHFKFSKC